MRVCLDSWVRHLYKPRPLLLVVALASAGVHAENVGGVNLPDGAVKVGENRYRVKDDFKGTLKYYQGVYPPAAYPRRPVVNQPGVKAVHIVNPSGKGFEGINIYEANDEVRVFIVRGTPEQRPGRK
jgi:hypothetical protein